MSAVGCTRTVVGGFVDSPDNTVRVYGRMKGAYGRAYTDVTPKTISITIVKIDKEETVLFSEDYPVKGGDLTWRSTWAAKNTLVITVINRPTSSITNPVPILT